jgi:hypothetical protein
MHALAKRKPERAIPAPASPPIRKEKSFMRIKFAIQRLSGAIIKNVLQPRLRAQQPAVLEKRLKETTESEAEKLIFSPFSSMDR